ncbi:uncharacterized protein YggL [Salmonella enterica subsp. salamae]|nr:uncharacterized protein YggL [Salmonella enterica subsp. salamae]
MAKNRSRRLRKKMHIDEFQELGFSVAWRFPEGTSEEQIDKTVDDFINDVIELINWRLTAAATWPGKG